MGISKYQTDLGQNGQIVAIQPAEKIVSNSEGQVARAETGGQLVLPEHQVIQRPSHIFRQDGHHNAVGPYNQISQGFPQERVQPKTYCLGSVAAAQGFAKVQLELDLRRLPANQIDSCQSSYAKCIAITASFCLRPGLVCEQGVLPV